MNHELLFHYTTADGAIGIINNKSLWATDIRFLNDSEEFIHGCKILKEITNQLKSGEIDHSFDNNFLDSLLIATESLVTGGDSSVTAYIISLSEKDDSLNQWRAYSGYSGYALGWDVNKLRKLAKLRGARLVKCIYDEGEQRKFVQRLIRFISRKVKIEDIEDIEENVLLKNCIIEFTIKYILQRFMPRLKNAAFEDEKEWRIVVTKNLPTLKFRAGRFGIIPYVEYSIANDDNDQKCINIFREKNTYQPDHLTVGPCENQLLAEIGVTQLINKAGKFSINKKLSKLPYRHTQK